MIEQEESAASRIAHPLMPNWRGAVGPGIGSVPSVVIPVPRRPAPSENDEAYLRGVRIQADIDIAAGR